MNKKKRPLGVWLLTIADGLFSGVFPLVVTVIVFHDAEYGQSLLELILLVFVCGGIMAAAIGAWCRDNTSRYLLLALMTVYWSLRLFNSISAIKAGDVPRENWGLVYGDLWRPVFWIGINWWYWLRRRTGEFYQG